jgi:hypothetical protein
MKGANECGDFWAMAILSANVGELLSEHYSYHNL